MFDIGGGELLLIILVVLLLFGPKKIPEIARTLGKGMSHLRRAQAEFQRNINDVSSDIERTAGLKDDPRPFRSKPLQLPDERRADQTEQPSEIPPPAVQPAEHAVARPARRQPPAENGGTTADDSTDNDKT